MGHLMHTFLVNDVTSKCGSTDDVVNSVHCVKTGDGQHYCQTSVTRVVELYRCENGKQRVPYSLVCDYRHDCQDSSDENFCVFPACNPTKEFECENKQCVDRTSECDDIPDCVDRTDELCELSSIRRYKNNPPPRIVHFEKRGVRYDKMEDPALCLETGTHFQCAGRGYCLPVFLRCNGVYDCPGKEDEADCRSYTCSGFYRCRGSTVCLHQRHLCDDIPQCPQHDDERFCNLTCPTNCTCQGLSYLCTQPFPAHLHPAVRYLVARDSGMKLTALRSNNLIVHLGNPLKHLFKSDELLHQNLRHLDLSQVMIEQLDVRRLGQHGAGGVLMTHLTAADFLMALHLCVVLVADAAYRDRYVFSDQQWRHSAACSVSGFLATLSSAVSTTVLCLLSSLCVWTLCQTRCCHQLGAVASQAVCVTVWVIGAAFASLPLLRVTPLTSGFSHTALCRPFPETDSHTPSPLYAVLELFNLVASLVLAVGIVVVNLREHKDHVISTLDSRSGTEQSQRPRYERFRRQVGELLVFSCLCRFLVGVFAVSPLGDLASAREVRLSVSLMVLPLWSALNPLLHWLGLARERARREKHERLMKRLLARMKH
ncbi:G-protein coupled receptor GRL101-like [Littorina saxatilis]|uniref:G-protein coupled receptor GRL101-like n=1 Tax=Littorina saxatilis TaxID=31220 RepID=UPI0038B4382C